MTLVIESLQNAKVKQVLRWREKSSARRKDGICLVEGAREVQRALKSGWILKECYTRVDVEFAESGMRMRALACSDEVFEKMVLRQRGVDVLGIFEIQLKTLGEITLGENPMILVLDGIEKPGNVGAILRTANAAGVDLVLASSLHCDLYSPEVIRNSLGGIFDLDIVDLDRHEIQRWLADQRIPVLQMHLSADHSPYELDLKSGFAVVFGSEDRGLDGSWNMLKGGRMKLPMQGVVDSLNVSVSAGVLLYEAVRQRIARR